MKSESAEQLHKGDLIGPLLRGEMAAVETYSQAISRVGRRVGDVEELRRIEAEHKEAAAKLQRRMEDLEAKPPESSGLWGSWTKVFEGTAKAFGCAAALKALKEGEEYGIYEYESALREAELDDGVKRMIRARFLPKTKAHVPVLERLLERFKGGRRLKV